MYCILFLFNGTAPVATTLYCYAQMLCSLYGYCGG